MSLPSYMQIGRGSSPGPVSGGYLPLALGSFDVAAGLTITNDSAIIAAVPLPFDFRIEAVSWGADSVVGGDTAAAFNLSYNTTVTLTADTDLLSAAVDVDANLTGIARPSGTTPTINSGSAGTTAYKARTIPQGSYLLLAANTTAATGGITDLIVVVWGFVVGHANADPLED